MAVLPAVYGVEQGVPQFRFPLQQGGKPTYPLPILLVLAVFLAQGQQGLGITSGNGHINQWVSTTFLRYSSTRTCWSAKVAFSLMRSSASLVARSATSTRKLWVAFRISCWMDMAAIS